MKCLCGTTVKGRSDAVYCSPACRQRAYRNRQRPMPPLRTPPPVDVDDVAALQLCPVTFADAREFVRRYHRHHVPPLSHKFSVGVAAQGRLVGVAMVGRPVARHLDDGWTLEVNRTCTDGYPNANSMLYGAAWRAARALGYRQLVTYTRASESGPSLRAAGWRVMAVRSRRRGWSTPIRPRCDDSTEHGVQRTLWAVTNPR